MCQCQVGVKRQLTQPLSVQARVQDFKTSERIRLRLYQVDMIALKLAGNGYAKCIFDVPPFDATIDNPIAGTLHQRRIGVFVEK
ncbi:hypothetical protein D3C80_2052970 [compost metagenome]